MLRNADYIYDNIIIADEVNTTKKYCKKAQVGVDLSVKNIYKIKNRGIVLREKTYVPDYELVQPTEIIQDRIGWSLQSGTYILELNEGIQLGKEDNGLIFQRSSLNRSGVTTISSVWDAGFTTRDGDVINTMTIRLNVDNKEGFILEQNARVAQILILNSEEVTALYAGQFQGGLRKSNLVDTTLLTSN